MGWREEEMKLLTEEANRVDKYAIAFFIAVIILLLTLGYCTT